MSEDISITNEEYKQLVDFHNKKIDHVYIQPHDESNPTMICHGGNGKIFYNGRLHYLSDIIEDVKDELNVNSKHFYLDVACCYASQLKPYIERGCTIRPRYQNEDVLNCKFNPEHVQFSYC